MSLGGDFQLQIEGNSAPLQVRSVRGHEALAAPYRLELAARVPSGTALDPEALLGAPARFELVHPEASRALSGLVDQIDETLSGYRIVLVPRIALLADVVDHRISVGKSALDIVLEVLRSHGLEVESRVSEAPEPRPQCVQAFETDLAFIDRLLTEEGISWYLDHGSGSEVVVLTDHAAGYRAMPGGELLELREGDGAGLNAPEQVFAVERSERMAVGRLSVCDFDFEKAGIDLTESAGEGPLECFEYRAGYRESARGKRLAARRLEQRRADRVLLRGRSTCRRLGPGTTFTLRGALREDLAGRWLVIELQHDGADYGGERHSRARAAPELRYEASFVAVRAESPYRASRPRRAGRQPSLGGLQTATVTGPGGAELHTEPHGRVKVRHRWDRSHQPDAGSSHWVRPVQPPLSGGFFLPRTGWEVLLGFEGPSADQPFVLGRIYNGEATPPEGLPGQKVRSSFGTQTTPGGGSGHQLRFDDAAGNEDMLFECSGDWNERTENDKGCTVKASETNEVGGNHIESVGILKADTITGAQDYSISANREVTTTGNLGIEAGSELVKVDALRFIQTGGDYETQAATLTRAVGGAKAVVALAEANRHVTGAATVISLGGWAEIGGMAAAQSVLGASSLAAGPMTITAATYTLKAGVLKETYASKTVTASAKRVEAFGGAANYSAASMSLKGAKVFFKADAKITIEAGGATITITPSAITFDAALKVSGPAVVTGDKEVP